MTAFALVLTSTALLANLIVLVDGHARRRRRARVRR